MKLKPTTTSMKKLKPTVLGKKKVEEKAVQPKRTKKENTLPKDEYQPMFEPIRILVRDDKEKDLKQYIEVSVKRMNDDIGLPYVWISMYQEGDFYTGYLKGKTNYFPLEHLYDIIDSLQDLADECDKRNIVD